MACGIEPAHPALEAWSLNGRTAREVPSSANVELTQGWVSVWSQPGGLARIGACLDLGNSQDLGVNPRLGLDLIFAQGCGSGWIWWLSLGSCQLGFSLGSEHSSWWGRSAGVEIRKWTGSGDLAIARIRP